MSFVVDRHPSPHNNGYKKNIEEQSFFCAGSFSLYFFYIHYCMYVRKSCLVMNEWMKINKE